jgi:hypothetical protein
MFKWFWIVVVRNAKGEHREISPKYGWKTQWEAQTNLQARFSRIPPDIGMKKGDTVVSYSVEMRRCKKSK